MLLEVILALTIMFASMGVIGIQIKSGLTAAHDSNRLTQAIMLAEAKLAQLDSGAVRIDREMEGDFGITFPGFFWRFDIQPHDDFDEVFLLTVEILWGTPEDDLEPGNIADADVVTTFYTWRPSPPTLNLQRDFGFSDEQMEEVMAALPPDVIDPTEISPTMFADLDLETMAELLPLLIQQFGAGFGFSEAQIMQAIESGLLDPSNLPTGAIDSRLQGLQNRQPPAPDQEDGREQGFGGGRPR